MLYDRDTPGDWGTMRPNSPTLATTEMLPMADGCQIFLRSWQTQSQDVLLLMHGLGGHSGWYVDMGNELAARGLTVYALDHRGFGRSQGIPGHIERADRYIEDLATVVKEIRSRHSVESQSLRVSILGHSMGGIFAAYLAARHGDLLDGVIFLNPWVQDHAKPSLSMTFGVLGGGLLGSKRRWRTPGGPQQMTTNPDAVQMLESDPYWQRELTASFLWQILLMRLQVLKQASQITLPALVLQANQDKSVVQAASHKLYETLASHDKTWIAYPDYAHDTQLEANRAQMDQDIVKWLLERAKTQ
jgi:alpha-beta hydrolase superfamily lysophospholipase